MRRLFDWYFQLSPWYQAAVSSLFCGAIFGALGALAFGKITTGAGGIFLGMFMGLLYYYQEWKDAREDDEITDYPEELEIIERRHAKQFLVLLPVFWLVGIAASWIVLGIGWYGLIAGFVTTFVVWWALGRFGGPSDPKWKKVRDQWRWERQRKEAGQAKG